MIIIEVFKLLLNIIYIPYRLLKTKHKVTFISRQSNKISIETEMIVERLNKSDNDLKIITINKKLDKNLKSIIENFLLLFKQMYHITTSKVVIIDGYCIPVSILRHKKDLIIIQTWHAAGIIKKIGLQTLETKSKFSKKIAVSMNMHKNYTYVISSSKETTKIFTKAFNVNKKQILEFGTPMLDYVYHQKNNKKEEILNKNPHINKPMILYLPTLRKNGKIDLDSFVNWFDFNNYDLVVKLHPVNKDVKLNKKIKKISGFKTEDLISAAEYVITDYSNVAFLAALSNTKVLFYIYDIEEYKQKRGLNVDLEKQFAEFSERNLKKLLEIIYNEKYDLEKFKVETEKHISTFDGKSTERICDFILEKVNNSRW